MRINGWGSTVLLAVIVGSYYVVQTQAKAQADARAGAVMSEVRKALGGEQKVAALKGLSLRAEYRREMSAGPMGAAGGGGATFVMMTGPAGAAAHGSAQATGKLEIDLDFPDRYLRSEIGSSGFSLTRTEGFEGSRPFMELVPNSPGMRVQVDNPAADPARAKIALRRNHGELARLLLGLMGSTQPDFPVTYSYGGQAESPDGKADIIDVAGPEDFKVRLFVDIESHLPLMLTFIEAEPRMVMRTMSREGPAGGRGGAPAEVTKGAAGGTAPAGTPAIAGLTPEQRAEIDKQRQEAEAAPPKMIEYRLYFSDYRKVDGVSLPHKIARGTGGKTTEEWDVTSYKVNPSFKADRFKVGS
jgi:hypothetical protein